MKTIGIYLGVLPQGGGAFQYNLSVIKALESLNSKDYLIVAFYVNKIWDNEIPGSFIKVYSEKNILQKVICRILKYIDVREGLSIYFAELLNPIIKKVNESNCDVIIFPAQESESFKTHKKSIATIHDLMHRYERHFKEYRGREYKRRESLYRNICRSVDSILVDSEIGKNHVMESYGLTPERIFILPFVPPMYLKDQPADINSFDILLPEKYILYPAQFWEHKNHINLIEAIKILNDYGMGIDLVLSGSKNNNYNKVKNKIAKYGLSKKVHIIGYVDNSKMVNLYKNALALVFVSLIGPTNIPPLEAMSLGCPVIVSNVYGMPEQVGDAALLIDPKNPQDIAEKVIMVLQDEKLRKTLIKKGYNQVNKWNQNRFNDRLKNIIDQAIEK